MEMKRYKDKGNSWCYVMCKMKFKERKNIKDFFYKTILINFFFREVTFIPPCISYSG